MGTFWENLVDTKVCGGYLLRSLLGSTERSATYLTIYGEHKAVLKLAAVDDVAPAIPPLDSPRIVQLYASGRCDLEGNPFHFFVMEPAGENLGSVVAARALTADEAQDMLKPVLEGLIYLHGRGLAHGRLKPSNILAVDDSIKLSVDSIRPSGAAASPEEDMRALGLTIIEVLTQERQPSAIAEIPQPLRDIVEHSLLPGPQLRWTAAQAAMRLSGSMPAPTVEEAPVVAQPSARFTSPAAAASAPPTVREPRKPVPFWVLPTTAAVMLMAVIYVLARGTGQSSDSSMAASVPPPVVTTPAPQPPRVIPPKPSAIEPLPKPVVKAAPTPVAKTANTSVVNGRGWFVVSAAYTREEDAAQLARSLGKRFPKFKLSVFPPSPIDTHYLVILGSGLSQDGAESLRQRAVASGLPHDTYIKRYPSSKP